MSEQQLVALIRDLAEQETGELRYRPPVRASRRVHRGRLVLLAVGTCTTAVAAVVAIVAFAGSGSSTASPGYATSPSEPAWFAPSVDYGPSSAEPSPGASDAVAVNSSRVRDLAQAVRVQVPQLADSGVGFETTGPDSKVTVRWALADEGSLTVTQAQLTKPLDLSALLGSPVAAGRQAVPYEVPDGVQLLVLGSGGTGEVFGVSPTGAMTQFILDARGPDPDITIDELRLAADPLARTTTDETPSAGPPTGLVTVPDILGLREPAALQALQAVGLSMGHATSQVTNDSVTPGTVIITDPSAGTKVQAGSAVDLTISAGDGSPSPAPTGTPLPSGAGTQAG